MRDMRNESRLEKIVEWATIYSKRRGMEVNCGATMAV